MKVAKTLFDKIWDQHVVDELGDVGRLHQYLVEGVRAVETLIDGAKDEPAIRDRMLKMIESHTMRLDEMVRDLLDLSRLESPEMPVRIGEIDLEVMATRAAANLPAGSRQPCSSEERYDVDLGQ